MSKEFDRTLQEQLDTIAADIDNGNLAEARREAGEFGEAVSGFYVNELADGNIVSQHNPGDAPQGIDTLFLDEDGDLHAGESKTIAYGEWHQPSTAATQSGRQMDQDWVASRLSDTGIEAEPDDVGPNDGDVHTDLFQIDIPGDSFGAYSLAMDGTRFENSPEEMWALSDIIALDIDDSPDSHDQEAAEPEDAEGGDGKGS